MTDQTVLLPGDASMWMCPLGKTYFRALSPSMQMYMAQHDFVIPSGHHSLEKVDQMIVLSEVRAHAT